MIEIVLPMSRIWICASMSKIIRADHLTALFVSDGSPDYRAAETNRSGVLWANVFGRTEPVRIDEFTGITAAELLDAVTKAIGQADPDEPVTYIRLYRAGDHNAVTRVKTYNSYPLTDGSQVDDQERT